MAKGLRHVPDDRRLWPDKDVLAERFSRFAA
jgi:hypothetical protein